MNTMTGDALRALADELRADCACVVGGPRHGQCINCERADRLETALAAADAAPAVAGGDAVRGKVRRTDYKPTTYIRVHLQNLDRIAGDFAKAGNDAAAAQLDSVATFIREGFAEYLDPRPHALASLGKHPAATPAPAVGREANGEVLDSNDGPYYVKVKWRGVVPVPGTLVYTTPPAEAREPSAGGAVEASDGEEGIDLHAPVDLAELWRGRYSTSGLCDLCGNSGIIDTRHSAVSPRGFRVGRLHWCVCPNGRIFGDINGDPQPSEARYLQARPTGDGQGDGK